MNKSRAAPIDIFVGNRLKNLRNEYNLSQQRIGKIIGVTYQQIQKYENGICRLGPSAMMKISDTLNIPVSYFFDGYSSPIENIIPSDTEAELAQMVSLFSKIKNPILRRELLDKARSYLNDEH